MSDKLDWCERHVVLFRHRTVEETVDQEHYELSTELGRLATDYPDSESFLEQLILRKDFKEACRFLCYNLHHRAAEWWGYLCVVNLLDELKKAPAEVRDISEIGKPKPFVIPEWAKEPPFSGDNTDYFAEIQNSIAKLKSDVQSLFDEDVLEFMGEVKGIFDEEQRKLYGMSLDELLQKAMNVYQGDDSPSRMDPNSPIFKAESDLKSQLEAVRTQTIETIKSVLPQKDEKKQLTRKASALDAVYRYVISPDDDNASVCLDIGNLLPDEPEGLLSLCAFWSYGNLAPGKNVVKTPAGMFANGLNGLLLMCALKEGGILTPKQRYEQYYNFGYAVASGANNWGESVEMSKIPHDAEPKSSNISRQEIKKQPERPIGRFRG